MIYDHGVSSIQNLWSDLLHTSQEVATGRRVLTPADDPIAAARALDISQSKSINSQFMTNQDYSIDNLRLIENKLNGVIDIYQYVRTSAIAAGDGILTQNELDYFATDMKSQFDALLALANTQDASGDFLFSGYRSQVQPFVGDITGVAYEGDQGTRTIQVSASRFMPVSFAGTEVFDNTRTFENAPNAFIGRNNTGTVVFGADYDPPQPDAANTGRHYDITFDGTNFNVVEYQPGNPTPALVMSDPGPVLNFNGLSVSVGGVAAAGDHFEVYAPSKNVFDNFALFVDALQRPGSTGIISGVEFIMGNLDFGIDTVSRVRAQIGSQLVELDQLKDMNSEMNIEYSDTLSRLQDVDYAEAISRMTQQRTYLEAAQQTFMKVSGLSLFNYL
jgi:flagellar hook-associated protein 3 FlgL